MRYVCYKTVVSKIVDENVSDMETIKDIIESFCNKELTCALRVGDNPTHSFCRVLRADSETFQYIVYMREGTLKRSARYADLEYLELKTNDEVIASLKPNPNRWILLEPDAAIGNEV